MHEKCYHIENIIAHFDTNCNIILNILFTLACTRVTKVNDASKIQTLMQTLIYILQ